jgi:competence protein ComEA
MRTELPAERLHRRIGAETDPEPDAEDDRADTSLSRWLTDSKSGGTTSWVAAVRADPGRAGVIALAVVGVIAVLVTVFTLVRDKPPPVVSAKLPPVQMVSSASPTPTSAASKPDEPVVVSVVGLVHKPGLVTLNPGARIADALTAAGGALDGADLIGLNMARRVADGEQIIVGIAGPPGQPTGRCTVNDGKRAGAWRFGGSEHRNRGTTRYLAWNRSGDRRRDRCLAGRQRAVH